ncbi:MAG: ribosomal protein L11 methyltransferase [Desulfobacterales bacterium CG2_30_60_27]|nr:MAG: ribosomal protein L11 methyltransferase [Desulfobacterales bacterium CG2_30_60_27]
MTDFSHRPARTWKKITLRAPVDLIEGVAAGLFALTGNGVELPEETGTPGEFATIIGYINGDDQPDNTEQEVLALLRELGLNATLGQPTGPRLDTVEEEDWGTLWKERYKPVRIGSRLIVRPSWEAVSAARGEIVVAIDPGMAFGTGLHATTQLALELLETCFAGSGPAPARILDVGTGTGILAITAALLGAQAVTATDLDPDAVHAARENARLNGVGERVTVLACDIADLAGPFDLVIANITHDVLLELAPHLNRLLATDGELIVTGLLTGWQTDDLAHAFEELGLRRRDTRCRDEWSALHLTKAIS